MSSPAISAPLSSEEMPWEEWSEGVRFGGRVRYLSPEKSEGTRIGFAVEELPPGRQSCPFHYHLGEEEHTFVLSGTALLRLGERTYRLKPGDYVCFPAGQEAGHCMINDGTEPFRYIMVGDRNPLDVCVYPDSGKLMVRAAKAIHPVRSTLSYYDGEDPKSPPAVPHGAPK